MGGSRDAATATTKHTPLHTTMHNLLLTALVPHYLPLSFLAALCLTMLLRVFVCGAKPLFVLCMPFVARGAWICAAECRSVSARAIIIIPYRCVRAFSRRRVLSFAPSLLASLLSFFPRSLLTPLSHSPNTPLSHLLFSLPPISLGSPPPPHNLTTRRLARAWLQFCLRRHPSCLITQHHPRSSPLPPAPLPCRPRAALSPHSFAPFFFFLSLRTLHTNI